MATEDLFHRGFLELTLKAFSQLPLKGAGDVYELYCGLNENVPAVDSAILLTFLRDLLAIRAQLRGVDPVAIQGFPTSADFTDLDEALINRLTDQDKGMLWFKFYHFPKTIRATASKRLYIHAKAPIELYGLPIIQELLRVPNADGLCNVKISGPGGTDRADTIVAYFSSKESLQAVIDALYKGQFQADCFKGGVPPGTLPLGYLKVPGVAGADEVPKDVSDQLFDRSSYGMFLSTLIFEAYGAYRRDRALQNATAEARKELFLQWVLAACKAARVDAKTIYLSQQDYNKLNVTPDQLAREMAQAKMRPA